MSNQRSSKRSSEEIYYSASEELEMFSEQSGQALRKRSRYYTASEELQSCAEQTVQASRKRSREEEAGISTEQTCQASRKWSRKEEAGSATEQTGQVPRKRSREEEEGSSAEQTGQASRKRSRKEEAGSATEQTGQVPRKRRREEEEGSSTEQTGQASRKWSRKEEAGSATEQTGQAPRKRSREEEEGSSAEQTGQASRKRSRHYTANEDLQSCAERKGEKRRWSQDTECESSLRKRRRRRSDGEGGTKSTNSTENVAAPTEYVVAPTEHVAAPTGNAAAPTGQTAAPTGNAAAPTGQAAAPTGQAAAPTGYEENDLTPESFKFHKILGSGYYGTVVLATHIDSSMMVAVKIVDKLRTSVNSNEDALAERNALEKVGGNHYCTHAYTTFQTENQLFYVMEYLSGGDLMGVAEGCDITTLRLTTAELVCGLQFIHSTGVIHRDLKLDNILIDSTGHIKIADFGIACVYRPEHKMLYDPSMDYFWLGVTLCDLAFGSCPTLCTRDNAMCCEMPPYPPDAEPDFMDLLEKLLCKGKEVRKATISNIRDHPFFREINWEEVEARETPPPFFVRRKGLRQVTKQTIPMDDLLNDKNIPAKKQVLFNGFSFESDQWRAIQKLN